MWSAILHKSGCLQPLQTTEHKQSGWNINQKCYKKRLVIEMMSNNFLGCCVVRNCSSGHVWDIFNIDQCSFFGNTEIRHRNIVYGKIKEFPLLLLMCLPYQCWRGVHLRKQQACHSYDSVKMYSDFLTRLTLYPHPPNLLWQVL